MLDAAEEAGVRVIWDIFHYGFPDFHDPARPDFADALADFAAAAAEQHRAATGRPIDHCIANEISFFCYAAGAGDFRMPSPVDPVALKRNVVRAAIAAADRLDSVGCGRRIWAEPLIFVAPLDDRPATVAHARALTATQYEVFDMLAGRSEPELGGRPELLATLGLNYYPHNQWYAGAGMIPLGHHEFRPLSAMLLDVAERYSRPLMIAETGAEGAGRVAWLNYVCDEVRQAQSAGVAVEGICLYPITAYPGWSNSRHCEAGLLGFAGPDGERPVYQPLRAELERQRTLFAAA
ncbi:hypothetical protein [Sphingomonas mesophila]|uniref:hypothetical protein n=1 Tax=Sphingomonas mesophila TaxID=2303576 RepID=UPI001966F315|nr:hypothetical protein [Sphingomonas mesophila]